MVIVPCMFNELDACAVFAHLKVEIEEQEQD